MNRCIEQIIGTDHNNGSELLPYKEIKVGLAKGVYILYNLLYTNSKNNMPCRRHSLKQVVQKIVKTNIAENM